MSAAAVVVPGEVIGTGDGLVPRPRLLRRLTEREVPLVLVSAAAGCGKTALLREWATRDPRRFSWLAPEAIADGRDDLAGLERIEPGRVVVVDGAERLPSAVVARAAALAERAPASSTIVLASRRALPIAVGRLHAHGVVVELGARDLAMTRMEAAMLLAAAGLRLEREQVDALVAQTQGWPVALALAAVALKADAPTDVAIRGFGGTDRLMADYVRTELLAPLPARLRRFARRVSLLAEPSASLCDAVLERSGTTATLGELSRAGVLLEPVDRSGTAFRWHRLVADVLRDELAAHEPELARDLHRRAAAVHDRKGAAGAAAHHAVHAGDASYAAGIVWTWACEAAARGDTADVQQAMQAFPERVRRAHPPLALATALVDAIEGRRNAAEHWLEAATAAHPGDVLVLQAFVGRRGLAQMGLDADRSAGLLAPHHPLQGLAALVSGAAHHLRGDRDTARRQLEQGLRRCGDDAQLLGALCEAQLALLDAERDDWEQAGLRAAAADARLAAVAADSPLRGPCCVAQAAAAAHLGDVAAARIHAARAHELLPAAAGFAPWLPAEWLVWLARTELRLSRAGAARRLLAAAARLAPQPDEAPVLSGWLHEAWQHADDLAAGSSGDGPQLTIAELRILRFLPSHLSFREIGARLHVSTNTVKTQALAVYRKLDVCSRSEAVARGRLLGLIGG